MRTIDRAWHSSQTTLLIVSPFVTGVATILTVIWTFWYGFRIRAQIASR